MSAFAWRNEACGALPTGQLYPAASGHEPAHHDQAAYHSTRPKGRDAAHVDRAAKPHARAPASSMLVTWTWKL
ncbi:MAG TPA: hypothetical protein VGX78_13225, partial [Pirellulales bacterium]|nr:hypothetical protein [Pirellulales bacterium]